MRDLNYGQSQFGSRTGWYAPLVDDWHGPDATAADPVWGVYGRISLASEEDQTGIDRQIADSTAEARRRGAKRVRIYRDDGRSAFERRVIREAFEQMLVDVAHGELVAVVAWRAERFARQPRDIERLLDAVGLDDNPPRARVYTVSDGVDTSTDAGDFVLRQLVQFGRWESRSISRRVARAHKDAIEKGKFSGSPPAFGHRDGTKWREIVPEEAALLREGAQRIVAGEGVRSVLRDFNIRGSRTRKGATWQHRAWIKAITSARMIGGRQVGDALYIEKDDHGKPWIAPILDRETWDQVRRILLDPARRSHDGGGTPRHLLTGLMRCALCQGPLRAKGNAGRKNGKGYWTYGCIRDGYHISACGRIWIKGDPTDDWIEKLVLANLRAPAVVAALSVGLSSSPSQGPDTAEIRTRLITLRERIIAVEAAWLDGPQALEERFGVSAEAYRRWRAEALAERDGLEARLARTERAASVLRAIADPQAYWDQAALAERRAVVSAVLPSITVWPARTDTRRWDARRITWAAAG